MDYSSDNYEERVVIKEIEVKIIGNVLVKIGKMSFGDMTIQ